MRGFADQRDAIFRDLRGPLDRKRKFVAAGLDRGTAEDRVRLLFDRQRKFLVIERDQPLGLVGRDDPDHAAAIAGQGHEHARAVRRMKFRRDVLVRAGMADVEGQRGLVEIAPWSPRCRRPRGKSTAVRRRRQRAAHEATWPPRVASETTVRRPGATDSASSSTRTRLRQLGRARLECCDQRAVVDVVAELLEADLLAGETHFRRTDQPAGIVDQPHDLQRRRTIDASPPRPRDVRAVRRKPRAGRGAVIRIGACDARATPSLLRRQPAQSQPQGRQDRRRPRPRHR